MMLETEKATVGDVETAIQRDGGRRCRPCSINDRSSLVFPDNTLCLDIMFFEDKPSLSDIMCSDDMTSLSEIPSMWNLKQLTRCSLYCCEKMEYILTKDQENPFLPTLNKLSILEVFKLRSICKDPMPNGGGSLVHLKTIEIKNCLNLKYVFFVRWLQALQNLEKITVDCCREMEEMVVETEDMGESSNNNGNAITLPRLRTLKLCNLSKLKSISKRIFVCNALEEIQVNSCPKLKKLPFSINSIPPSLKFLHGSNKWWNSLEWDNSDAQSLFASYFYSVEDDDEVEDDDGHDHVADGVVHEEEAAWNQKESRRIGPFSFDQFLVTVIFYFLLFCMYGCKVIIY